LVSFRGFLEDYIFGMVKYLSFHNSSFCLKDTFLMSMARSQCDTALVSLMQMLANSKVHSFIHSFITFLKIYIFHLFISFLPPTLGIAMPVAMLYIL
jgi:hypothetical protein